MAETLALAFIAVVEVIGATLAEALKVVGVGAIATGQLILAVWADHELFLFVRSQFIHISAGSPSETTKDATAGSGDFFTTLRGFLNNGGLEFIFSVAEAATAILLATLVVWRAYLLLREYAWASRKVDRAGIIDATGGDLDQNRRS